MQALDRQTQQRQALERQARQQPLNPAKALVVEAFAKVNLGALRTSAAYLGTLSRILDKFKEAKRKKAELILSSRDDSLGPRQTLRTLQNQLHAAGYLVEDVRPQGHGFVGTVYIYKPPPPWLGGISHEALCLAHGGKGPATMPPCVTEQDVPF